MKRSLMTPRTKRETGATLVEILVVIVVFLVGVLSIAQIFPKGLGILKNTRDVAVGNQLARSEMERLKGFADQLAEAILPVQYVPTASGYVIDIDLDRRPDDYLPNVSGVRQTGVLMDPNGGDMGEWPYFSGPNVIRRVFGEGRTIPAPRFVPTGVGQAYGGLMTLQFAPVVADSRVLPGSRFQSPFSVYGNDMSKRVVDEDITDPFPFGDPTAYYVTDEGDKLVLPQGSRERAFRVSLNFYSNETGQTVHRSRVGVAIVVPGAGAGVPMSQIYDLSALGSLFAGPGESFEGFEVDTIRVQRLFDRVGDPSVFTTGGNREDAAYEYCLLDRNLGMVMFNPAGFNFQERRGRGRIPMQARVDYDVFDWRIIRDDFRIPTANSLEQKLIMQGLKVQGRFEPDGRTYRGLGFFVRNQSGVLEERDFVMVDLETGGVFSAQSYNVDKSIGLVSFIDQDNDASNGLTAAIVYPGMTTATVVPDVRGRSVRALYQANGEWSVQATKAAASYQPTRSVTLGYGQCYPGLGNGVSGLAMRVYFPLADIGKKVIVGEAWYIGGNGGARVLEDQELTIRSPRQGELQLGYIDLREKDPQAVSLDWSNGYSIRRVRGSTISIKVSSNPASFNLGPDPAINVRLFGTWMQNLRSIETETFLTKGGGAQ